MAKKRSTNGASLSGWKSRRLHRITGPTGQRMRIELLGIAALLQSGDLPDDLLELGLMELTEKGGATGELSRRLSAAEDGDDAEAKAKALAAIQKYGEFQKRLAIAAVKEIETAPDVWEPVTLTVSDVESLPEDDLAMVAEIVQRLRAHDAVGVRVGVEPLDRWATFCESHRGIPCTCDEDCEGCKKLVAALSSIDVGGV